MSVPARRPEPGGTRAGRALRSPVAGVAAVVGGVVGAAVTGFDAASILPAAVFAAVGWGGGAFTAAATSGRRRRPRIDPFALGEPWRHFVRGALQAQARYDRTVSQTRPGPLRDRLEEIGRRIDVGVDECWEVAQRGDALKDALRALDEPSVRRRLDTVTNDATGDDDDVRAGTADALRARLQSAERLRAVSDDAENRLRLLDARLGEAVARGVELSMHRGEDVEAAGLGRDVDELVLELTALRAALDETEGGPGRTDPAGGTAGLG